jgi:hypothetical protein
MERRNMDNNKKYSNLKINSLFTLNSDIETHFPTPIESDYKRGWITRYFIQKTNDKSSTIYETNYSQYSKILSNALYTGVIVRWRISGPIATQYDSSGNVLDKGVRESNRIAISLVSDKIPNLKFYLPNLLQFHK